MLNQKLWIKLNIWQRTTKASQELWYSTTQFQQFNENIIQTYFDPLNLEPKIETSWESWDSNF